MRALVVVALAAFVAGCTLPEPEVGLDDLPRASRTEPPNVVTTQGLLRVHVVDVGQGDAVVWELPDGSVALYDCGPPADDAQANPVVRFLRDRLGLAPGDELALLVASHGHLDHVGGCEEVLATYRVRNVVEAWYEGDDAPRSYARFLDGVRAEGALVHTMADVAALDGEVVLRAGDLLPLPAEATAAGARAELLWPLGLPDDWDRIAEASLVVRLAFGGTAACFAGDVEIRQEEAVVARGGDLDCEFLLVGHHGSRHATGEAWLAATDPEVAVVSFGENGYGHPTSEALCRVQRAGAEVYATHRVGTVTVTLDGANATATPDRPERTDHCATGADYWAS